MEGEMPIYAERMNRLGTETAFTVLTRANELVASGRVVHRFEIGETGFETPEFIIEAVVSALRTGRTKYGPPVGNKDLRQVVAHDFSRTRNITVDADSVVVTVGAKPIIAFAMLACVNPGDEVIVPDPGFPIYASMANFCQARVIPWALRIASGFQPDPRELEKLITSRTAMIVINSPHNPTGSIISQRAMDEIVKVLVRVGYRGWILTDEVYRELIFTEQLTKSLLAYPELNGQVIGLDGWSKKYSMTGLRLGCGTMPHDLAQKMGQLATNFYSCPPPAIQDGGLVALTGPDDFFAERKEILRQRRDRIVSLLNSIPGVGCPEPDGAFYVYPDVSRITNSASRLAKLLLERAGVAVLGGRCFGTDECGADRHIRLCYSTNDETGITVGIQAMADFLATQSFFRFDLTSTEPTLV
jgi:aspartate/methionine/tyrosine aminotransferase